MSRKANSLSGTHPAMDYRILYDPVKRKIGSERWTIVVKSGTIVPSEGVDVWSSGGGCGDGVLALRVGATYFVDLFGGDGLG